MKATNAPPLPTNVILELTPDEAQMLRRVAQLNVTIPEALKNLPAFSGVGSIGFQPVVDFLDNLYDALLPRTAPLFTREPKQ